MNNKSTFSSKWKTCYTKSILLLTAVGTEFTDTRTHTSNTDDQINTWIKLKSMTVKNSGEQSTAYSNNLSDEMVNEYVTWCCFIYTLSMANEYATWCCFIYPQLMVNEYVTWCCFIYPQSMVNECVTWCQSIWQKKEICWMKHSQNTHHLPGLLEPFSQHTHATVLYNIPEQPSKSLRITCTQITQPASRSMHHSSDFVSITSLQMLTTAN